jgi:hypothetical protein
MGGYSNNSGVGDSRVNFDNFNGIRQRIAYLIKIRKNSTAPPYSSRVMLKGGETGATLTISVSATVGSISIISTILGRVKPI